MSRHTAAATTGASSPDPMLMGTYHQEGDAEREKESGFEKRHTRDEIDDFERRLASGEALHSPSKDPQQKQQKQKNAAAATAPNARGNVANKNEKKTAIQNGEKASHTGGGDGAAAAAAPLPPRPVMRASFSSSATGDGAGADKSSQKENGQAGVSEEGQILEAERQEDIDEVRNLQNGEDSD